jgi:hypothetical protein
MICSFCGCEFDPKEANAACRGCLLVRGCHLVRCPRCGYEMPPESKLLAWLKNRRRANGENRESAK